MRISRLKADEFEAYLTARMHRYICYGKSSPSPPPSPDYAGAARATAQGNLEATRYATEANRFNQYSPYGQQTWQRPTEENPDQWSTTTELAPKAQEALDSQMNLSAQMGALGENRAGAVSDAFNAPTDNSVQDVYNRAYATQTDRLDPQFERSEDRLNTQLANQGIKVGSEAYSNSMRDFNQGKNDAYTQARMSAINTMPMTQQMASALRNQPLNELNAIRTGAQIQNPTFQQGGMQQATAGPDMLGAAGAQNQYNMGLYNSQVGGNNSAMGGLMGLAGAGLQGWATGGFKGF